MSPQSAAAAAASAAAAAAAAAAASGAHGTPTVQSMVDAQGNVRQVLMMMRGSQRRLGGAMGRPRGLPERPLGRSGSEALFLSGLWGLERAPRDPKRTYNARAVLNLASWGEGVKGS